MAASPEPNRSFRTKRMGRTIRLVVGRVVESTGNGLLAISTVAAFAALVVLAVAWWRNDNLQLAVDLFLWAGRGLLLAATLMAVGRFIRRRAVTSPKPSPTRVSHPSRAGPD